MTQKDNKQDMAMAIVLPESNKPLQINAAWIKWTKEALTAFNQVLSAAQNHYQATNNNERLKLSLPTGSLRMLFQCQIDELLSVENYMGLESWKLAKANNYNPFSLFIQGEDPIGNINQSLEEWIENELTVFIERHEVPDAYREELFYLLDKENLIICEKGEIQVFPWSQGSNGTAKPVSNNGFSFSANDIAYLLEGKEIFPELPPMRRVTGTQNNKAELMTPPQNFVEGRFSLVCQISVETLPGLATPLIYTNFIRRRWFDSLKEGFTKRTNKTAFLLPTEETKAYSFQLEKTKQTEWEWRPDTAWDALSRRFPLGQWDSSDIASHTDGSYQILVSHDFETQGSNKNKLGAGVPERDRLDAFNNILDILKEYGFEAFQGFTRIDNPKKIFKNAVYLKAEDFEDDEQEEAEIEKDNQSFKQLDQSMQLELALSDIHENKIIVESEGTKEKKNNKRPLLSTINQELMQKALPETKPSILLVTQDQSQQALLTDIIQRLFGDTLIVRTTLLPDNTHGVPSELPDSKESDSVRLKSRCTQWRDFANHALDRKTNELCLIEAKQFYQVEGNKSWQHDDKVNKSATKLTLAGKFMTPVQYLTPPNFNKKNEKSRLEDYVLRTQQALLDLVFGHQGLVPGLSDYVSHYHQDDQQPPSHLMGITVLSPNKVTREKYAALAVASRLDVITGKTEIRFCHKEEKDIITKWMPFREAIGYIARKHNQSIFLGKYLSDKQKLFQSFCKEILDEAQLQSSGAYIYFKAETCNSYWPWLTDSKVNFSEAVFTDGTTGKWSNLRLIRIREQTPKLIQKKIKEGFLKPTTIKSMFKVNTKALPVYWSLGEPVQQITRGLSCYRSITVPHFHPITKERSYKECTPYLGLVLAPNAIEMTILSCLDGDDADQLANFSASLRRGILQARLEKWVRMPSPLFVISKLEEYLKL